MLSLHVGFASCEGDRGIDLTIGKPCNVMYYEEVHKGSMCVVLVALHVRD